ncbi:hypothetical protein B0H14DRAFT_531820 [Mycena olivaceomarginata]|nr:hypothetical protein B0H14DRAFT_531820 [Mycena olivaceomarginata]
MIALVAFALFAAVLTNARPVPHPLTLVSRALNDSDICANWPTYDQLPLHPSFPTKAAWGVWVYDELGAQNHISGMQPSSKQRAKSSSAAPSI